MVGGSLAASERGDATLYLQPGDAALERLPQLQRVALFFERLRVRLGLRRTILMLSSFAGGGARFSRHLDSYDWSPSGASRFARWTAIYYPNGKYSAAHGGQLRLFPPRTRQAIADAPPALATQVGHASLQGFTAVFGLFSAPQRTQVASALAFEDAAGVASAYEQMRAAPAAKAAAAAAAKAAAAAAAAPPRRTAAGLVDALKDLSARKLRGLMSRLGLEFVPGLEKSEYVEAIAKTEGAEEALDEEQE